MLGILRPVQGWSWAAYGKHPSAGDYIRLGQESPLAKSFADWVQRGYEALGTKKNTSQDPVAWRFWARGAGKDNIVCGVVRDSSDRLGRHYPLLFIGTGQLKDWESRWDLLPLAFDKSWGHIEYASARMAGDLQSFADEVRNIRPPSHEWPGIEASRKGIIESITSSGNEDLESLKTKAAVLSGKQEGFINLDNHSFQDQFALINCWHMLLKNNFKSVPNAVFIGGTFSQSFMVFFNRSLQTADFVHLWSVSSAGIRENGSLVTGLREKQE